MCTWTRRLPCRTPRDPQPFPSCRSAERLWRACWQTPPPCPSGSRRRRWCSCPKHTEGPIFRRHTVFLSLKKAVIKVPYSAKSPHFTSFYLDSWGLILLKTQSLHETADGASAVFHHRYGISTICCKTTWYKTRTISQGWLKGGGGRSSSENRPVSPEPRIATWSGRQKEGGTSVCEELLEERCSVCKAWKWEVFSSYSEWGPLLAQKPCVHWLANVSHVTTTNGVLQC